MNAPLLYAQSGYDLRCEWGLAGVLALAPHCAAVIIVDVLSFCTCVDVAVGRGAAVLPFASAEPAEAAAFAAQQGAVLASRRGAPGAYSLSPASLRGIPAGTRLVLPSPNGSTLSLAAAERPVFAGCLRNAAAVARAAAALGKRIAVIPAGERWRADHTLRPAFEDLLGAGAILSHLPGRRSPEAEAAVAAYHAARPRLADLLAGCSSGLELSAAGYDEDVRLAAELDVSSCAPRLVEGAFGDG